MEGISESSGGVEEYSWDEFWPPEVPDDPELIRQVVQVIGTEEYGRFHQQAWELLTNAPGLDLQYTLLSEFRAKSGSVSMPFIDVALSNVFCNGDLVSPTQLGESIRDVLIPAISACEVALVEGGEDDFTESDRIAGEDRLCELYRGCVWELAAMFCACLVSLITPINITSVSRIPASCNEPVDRAFFIKQQVRSLRNTSDL